MKNNQKRWVALGLCVLFLLVIIGCAPGNERFEASAAGFWAGLWHGFICLFTFIIGLFTDSVRIYEVSNTGGWYHFGFILGVAAFFSSSCESSKKKRRKKSQDSKKPPRFSWKS